MKKWAISLLAVGAVAVAVLGVNGNTVAPNSDTVASFPEPILPVQVAEFKEPILDSFPEPILPVQVAEFKEPILDSFPEPILPVQVASFKEPILNGTERA